MIVCKHYSSSDKLMARHIIMKWTEITFWAFIGAFMTMPYSGVPEEMIIYIYITFCFASNIYNVSFTKHDLLFMAVAVVLRQL